MSEAAGRDGVCTRSLQERSLVVYKHGLLQVYTIRGLNFSFTGRQTKHKSMRWTKQGSVVLWCVQPVQLTIITTLTLPPSLVAVECGSERENKQVVTWRKSRCSRARFELEMVTIIVSQTITHWLKSYERTTRLSIG